MFEKFSLVFTTHYDVTFIQSLNVEILPHLSALADSIERYFLKLNRDKLDLLRHPFRLRAEKVPDEFRMNFWSL